MSPTRQTVQSGDVVILQRSDYMKTHHYISGKAVTLGRDKINTDLFDGCRYGTTFKLKPLKNDYFDLESVNDSVVSFEETFLKDGDNGRDNRNLVGGIGSQKLSRDEIEKMRGDGIEGTEIVGQLIENSETFTTKTRYSQVKFLKKKAAKYFPYLTIRKPSVRLLMQIYYKTDPMKLMNLRIDSLAQLLNHVNVRAGARFVVYESGCQGIIVASMLERIGKIGKLVHIHQTGSPQTKSLEAMNFDAQILDNLFTLRLTDFRALTKGSTAISEKSSRSFDLMKNKDMDGLIIACKQYPTEILISLIDYLAPSRSFAVYCPYKEPLIEAYGAIKDSGSAVMVTLSESWLRNYQVLPGRTHPEMLMSGGGGYILAGIKISKQ